MRYDYVKYMTQENNENRYVKYTLIFLCAVLFVLCVFLFREYENLKKMEIIRPHEFLLNALEKRGAPATLSVNDIESWMTFSYLNRVFNLPTPYLEISLSIVDPHYPYISIKKYAQERNSNIDVFLQNIKTAINEYESTKK